MSQSNETTFKLTPITKTKKKKIREQLNFREQNWDNRVYRIKLTGDSVVQNVRSINQNLGKATSIKRAERVQLPDKLNLSQGNQSDLYFSNAKVVLKYIKMNQNISNQNDLSTMEMEREQRIQQLRQVWKSFKIPDCHTVSPNNFIIFPLKQYFNGIIRLLKINHCLRVIEEEEQIIQAKNSPVQRCIFAASAREKCLKTLFDHLGQVEGIPYFDELNPMQQSEFIERIQELIIHLRLLSLNVTEGIMHWRSYMKQKKQSLLEAYEDKEHLIFAFQQSNLIIPNYLLKINEDYMSLRKTILINFYRLPDHPDPFFITILKDTTNLNIRIRKCELEIILEGYRSLCIEVDQKVMNLSQLCELVQEYHPSYIDLLQFNFYTNESSKQSTQTEPVKNLEYFDDNSSIKKILSICCGIESQIAQNQREIEDVKYQIVIKEVKMDDIIECNNTQQQQSPYQLTDKLPHIQLLSQNIGLNQKKSQDENFLLDKNSMNKKEYETIISEQEQLHKPDESQNNQLDNLVENQLDNQVENQQTWFDQQQIINEQTEQNKILIQENLQIEINNENQTNEKSQYQNINGENIEDQLNEEIQSQDVKEVNLKKKEINDDQKMIQDFDQQEASNLQNNFSVNNEQNRNDEVQKINAVIYQNPIMPDSCNMEQLSKNNQEIQFLPLILMTEEKKSKVIFKPSSLTSSGAGDSKRNNLQWNQLKNFKAKHTREGVVVICHEDNKSYVPYIGSKKPGMQSVLIARVISVWMKDDSKEFLHFNMNNIQSYIKMNPRIRITENGGLRKVLQKKSKIQPLVQKMQH